jgi:hypothetical protein
VRRPQLTNLLSLLVLILGIMLTGCVTSYVVVGTDPCPAISEKALTWWEARADNQRVTQEELEFRVWMGRMVNYCEAQEERLDG